MTAYSENYTIYYNSSEFTCQPSSIHTNFVASQCHFMECMHSWLDLMREMCASGCLLVAVACRIGSIMKYVVAIRAMCSFLFESLIRLGYKSDVRRSALFNLPRRCSKWNFPSAHFTLLASAFRYLWGLSSQEKRHKGYNAEDTLSKKNKASIINCLIALKILIVLIYTPTWKLLNAICNFEHCLLRTCGWHTISDWQIKDKVK